MRKEHTSLYGLVNNAGGVLATARATVELNTYAVIRVTRAFLPLLQGDKGRRKEMEMRFCVLNSSGRIVMISSAAGPNFVSKCSEDIQRMLVSPEVTFKETEERVIAPYLRIMEDASILEDGRNAALEAVGLTDSGSVGAGYGVSKAALNAYTVEVARSNPGLLVNACTPGFIETDLTRPMADR